MKRLKLQLMMVVLVLVIINSGCFTKRKFIRPRYPVLSEVKSVKLKDILGEENTPYKKMALKLSNRIIELNKLINDNKPILLKLSEIKQEITTLNKVAKENEKAGNEKHNSNYVGLLKGIKKARISVEKYNEYAKKWNKNSGLYESLEE